MRVFLALASLLVQAGAHRLGARNFPVRYRYQHHSIISTTSWTMAYYADNPEFLKKIFAKFPVLDIVWNHEFAKGLVKVWIQAAWYNRRILINSQDRRVEFRIIVDRSGMLPFKEIQRTNDIYSKTITAVLFNLQWVRNIPEFYDAYDSFFHQNISIGVIYIEREYHIPYFDHCIPMDISSLPLEYRDFKLVDENKLETCLQFAKSSISPTVHLYKERADFENFEKAGDGNIPFRLYDPTLPVEPTAYYDMRILSEPNAYNCGLNNDLKQKHIAKPKFASEFFGFSVYFDEFDSSHNPIIELLAASPKLMLENKKPFNVTARLEIDNLLLTIAHELLRREHIIVNIAIKLNFDEGSKFVDNSVRHEVHVNITQQVWDASRTANRIYPGLVHGIFLQIYNRRTDSKFFRWDYYSQTTVTANDDLSRLLSTLRPNPIETQLPKIGVSYKLDSLHSVCSSNSVELPGNPSIVLLEYTYRFGLPCFYKDGFYKQSTNKMRDCTQKIKKSPSGAKVNISYYFEMRCLPALKHPPLKLLHHQRKLIATLSRESEFNETSVYANNAFQYQENPPYGSFGLCGWWNFSAPEKPNGTYRIEDRVDVANRALGFTIQTIQQNYTKIIKSEAVKFSMWWIILPVALVLGALCLLCALVLRYRSKYQIKSREIERFFNGDKNNQDKQEGTRMALCSKYDKTKYEIPDSAYSIDKTKCLGSGEFGIVYSGVIRTTNEEIVVAVKTTKYIDKLESASIGCTTALRSLMGEIKVLAYMGQHQNMVYLIGANTAKLDDGNLLVFLEYCENGSLMKHLRSLDLSHSETGLDLALSKQFLTWANDIADGMNYLATKKIVHADLATRNILLDSKNVAKISDFGLSRRLYEYSQYVKTNQEPLPWRWMAPESLTRLEFSEKSDVWAYGVTLWEIYSLADTPYAGLSWTPDFVPQLEAGLKLAVPKYNDNNMFTVMTKCWSYYPFERPQFSDLKRLLPSRSTFENDARSEYNEVVPLEI